MNYEFWVPIWVVLSLVWAGGFAYAIYVEGIVSKEMTGGTVIFAAMIGYAFAVMVAIFPIPLTIFLIIKFYKFKLWSKN